MTPRCSPKPIFVAAGKVPLAVGRGYHVLGHARARFARFRQVLLLVLGFAAAACSGGQGHQSPDARADGAEVTCLDRSSSNVRVDCGSPDQDGKSIDVAADTDAAAAPRPRLSAFDFTIQDWPKTEQVALLSGLGYEGVAISFGTPASLEAFIQASKASAAAFKVAALHYYPLDLAQPLDEAYLNQVLPALARSQAALWVMLRRGDPERPTAAHLANLRALADRAAAYGVEVVLYPHYGNILATAEQGLEWLRLAQRENLKLSLHLCHELKAGNVGRLPEIISLVSPFLSIVTVNGADEEFEPGDIWARTIQPLDRGTLDVRRRFVEPLLASGYSGPIVLHTFGITDAPQEHFARSARTWETWMAQP